MRLRARVNKLIDTGIIIISYVPVVLYVYACVGTHVHSAPQCLCAYTCTHAFAATQVRGHL